MNERKEDTQDTNNDAENISIEIASETEVLEPKKSQTKEEKISIPKEKHLDILAKQKKGLKKIASEDVNPLFYEIGPFPRTPQRVWVQVMGLHPVPTDEEPLDYDPSRNDFVRLVFSIVLIMLICTCGICTFCNIFGPVKSLFTNPGTGFLILICSGILTISMSYAFTCSQCTRTFPCNVICLTLTVIGFSAICSFFIIKYKAVTVILAIASTTVIVLVCLGLACTSFDFTRFLLVVIVAMLAVSIATLAYFLYCAVTGESIKPLHAVLLVAGTLLHSVFLIITFQMVIGGQSLELSEDDYSLGAFWIYISIIHIFLDIIRLLGLFED